MQLKIENQVGAIGLTAFVDGIMDYHRMHFCGRINEYIGVEVVGSNLERVILFEGGVKKIG